MNWSDKAKEIAESIYDKMFRPNPSQRKENLMEMLEKAAIQGMEHELQLWMNRPKKETTITDGNK